MRIVKRPDGWWIVDTPPDILETGPYSTKAEAEDDMRGVEQFCQDYPEKTYLCEAEQDGPVQ